MITLGGYTLNPNMVWSDRDSWYPTAQAVTRTLGGKLVVSYNELVKGRPITLVATQDQGWISYAQRNSLLQMAGISGGIFTLVVGADSFEVMFRHEEPPALEFKAMIDRITPEIGDYFLGQIKLIEV